MFSYTEAVYARGILSEFHINTSISTESDTENDTKNAILNFFKFNFHLRFRVNTKSIKTDCQSYTTPKNVHKETKERGKCLN